MVNNSKLPFGVNIAGYIDTESGVGEAVRGVIRNLEDADVKISLTNIEQQWLRRNDKTYNNFSMTNPYFFNILNVNADQVPHIANILKKDYFKDRYNIGYWFWELSDFPSIWQKSFDYFDEIWTASDFCVDAISKLANVPVVKMPISIGINPKNEYSKIDFGVPKDSFMFLFMFDFMSFFERKNPLAVINAFHKAFKEYKEDEVVLVIKFSNSNRDETNRNRILDRIKGLPVKIIDGYLDKGKLHDLLACCDCYISLHRSEGLGLTLAEAMSVGKPIIGTAYSGNMEFMNVNNSYLVKYKLINIEDDIFPYQKGNEWADVDIEHSAKLMKEVYENRQISNQIGRKAKEYMNKNYTRRVLGRKMKNRLKLIYNEFTKAYPVRDFTKA